MDLGLGVGGAGQAQGGGVLSMMMPRPPASARKTARADSKAGAKKVWVLRQGQPVAVAVNAGISDGRVTEVVGGELAEGDLVITDQRGSGGKS